MEVKDSVPVYSKFKRTFFHRRSCTWVNCDFTRFIVTSPCLKNTQKVSLIYNMAIFLLCSGWILVFIFIPPHFSRVNLHKFYEIPSKISYIVGNPFLSVVWKSISILFLHLCQAEVEQWRKGKRGSRNLKKSLSKIRSSFPFSTCALVS